MSELAYENCYGVINNHIIGKSTVDNRNLALVYDPDSVYMKGDHCIHGMKYWVCNTNNTTGAWDATKWTQTRVGDEITPINYFSNVTWSKTVTSGYVKRAGNVVNLQMIFDNLSVANNTTLFTLPVGSRPNAYIYVPIFNYANGQQIAGCAIEIAPGGAGVYLGNASLSNGRISFNACYISV